MRENDKVWYACYGSNLSAERFSYYIEGGSVLSTTRIMKVAKTRPCGKKARFARNRETCTLPEPATHGTDAE